MKLSDMFQAVDLLYNEWDLGKRAAGAKGKICAWIYLMEILEETETIVTYKEGKKLIGFCGYAKWNSNKHKIKKKIYHSLKKFFLYNPTIKDRSAIQKYLETYSYTPDKLKDYFDGEISILIVDKNYRGKGIGKELLLKNFENAKNDKVKRLQILSDESCNFKIYETCGCKKVYETTLINGEKDTQIGYIYEKML